MGQSLQATALCWAIAVKSCHLSLKAMTEQHECLHQKKTAILIILVENNGGKKWKYAISGVNDPSRSPEVSLKVFPLLISNLGVCR